MTETKPETKPETNVAAKTETGAGKPAKAAKPAKAGAVRIASKVRPGFRRCGWFHTYEPVEHPAGIFSDIEIEALKAEPNLTVEEI